MDSLAEVKGTSNSGTGTHQPNQTTKLVIQGVVMICHSLRLSNQTSGMVQCQAHPGMPKMCHGDAGRFWWAHQGCNLSGSTIPLQMAVVFASPIPGLMNRGWWATWLTHKQLKNTNVVCPSKPWAHTYEINKEMTLPCMFNSPTPAGHWDS